MLRFFFGQNSLFHSAKEVFLQTFRQFLQNWIFDGKSTAADLTKLVKILYYLKCAKKIFFDKILCSTQQKKCFYKLIGSFRKIEFFTENQQPRTLQKWWKFCTISKCAKSFFFRQNSLFHSAKEVFLQTFRQFLQNWIFDGKSTAADLTKLVKICTISNVLRKYFLTKFFVPLNKRSVSTNC